MSRHFVPPIYKDGLSLKHLVFNKLRALHESFYGEYLVTKFSQIDKDKKMFKKGFKSSENLLLIHHFDLQKNRDIIS